MCGNTARLKGEVGILEKRIYPQLGQFPVILYKASVDISVEQMRRGVCDN